MSLLESDWLEVAWRQVWQVTVLIVAVALLIRCAARNRPQLAFALWLVVLLKCVTPPLWSSPTGALCWLQPPQATITQDSPATLAVAVLPADAVTARSRADADFPLTDNDGRTCHLGLELLHPTALLAVIWGLGIVAVLAAIAVQRRRVTKLIRQANADASTPYTAILASLAHRLRIHRLVRLVVTESPVGPAVLGLARPTILLPRAVIDGKLADEIELILAHELMHVRRGDLWLALLRSLVLSLWWFHPLVWWAGRRASREAERCCDDAVLAELRYSPARYARCLLDILEIKHRLSPVPAFPGVRAIEVNQGRLERIMKIGHGGYRRTPWWCWGVTLLAAIAVLPGRAMRISAGEGANGLQAATPPRPVAINLGAYAASARSKTAAPALGAPIAARDGKAPPDKVIYEARSYFVGDVLARIREERGLSESRAKEFLAEHMKGVLAGPAGDPHKRPQPEQVLWPKDGDDLVIGATRDGHKRVAATIEAFRQFGTAEITVEVRFVALPQEELQKVLPDSTMSPLTVDGAALANSDSVPPAAFDRPLGTHAGTRVARAQCVVEKDAPVRFQIVDKEPGAKLINRFQEDHRTSTLQAPKIRVFNGQTAFVSDTSQSPFVVGVVPLGSNAQQPQIRVVSEGTTLLLRPIADRSGAIHLDFAATFSKIQEVETATFNRTPTGGTTIQIPKVATVRMEGGAVLKEGQWLLLGGSKADDPAAKAKATPVSWEGWLLGGGNRQKQRETQELVLMLRTERIPLPRATGNHVSPAAERD